jgi:hypothetical protein
MNETMRTSTAEQRGSALLVSLMVLVGLSLLGLGFVAVSETESAIATNERNRVQTQALAEAAAKTAVEWFQAPWDLDSMGILPPNDDDLKRDRVIGGSSIGRYKPDTSTFLFDKPFKGLAEDKLYGDEAHADVFIDRSTADGQTFLDNFNTVLFGHRNEGEITEILVYAPPIVGGTVNGSGFYEGGVRYGLATIKATAVKYAEPSTRAQVIAQRSVKIVVSEWPFPGPQGPIQSNANITTGGNYGVHWGKMTSQGSMNVARALQSIPWFNAHDRVHLEFNYPGFIGSPATPFVDDHDWLAELVDRTFEDPWYEARARGDIVNPVAPNGDPVPFVHNATTDNVANTPDTAWSNWFQDQAFTQYPNYKEVLFPKIDYDFWKEIAIQGAASGQEGVYYLWPCVNPCTPAGGENYTDGTTVKNFAQWVNTARAVDPARAGFYFFDTVNQLNPQGPGAAGTLAPAISVNSSDDGNDFRMMGFIYINAVEFGSQGVSPPVQWVNFPGEPYRDVGYNEVDGGGNLTGVIVDAANGKWDYQDLNNNDIFDVHVDNTSSRTRPSGGAPFTPYLPVAYFNGCVTPNNDNFTGATCSEPHEPYLNIIYPTQAKSGGGPQEVTAGWQANGTQGRRPKRAPGGSAINCASSANWSLCTSNRWDRDGGMVNDIQLFSNGVVYIEGDFGDTTGNAEYFGSLLVNGDVSGTGTPEVWFDERLIKGDWPPPEFNFPRVYISAQKTDD